eukprot:CAMPEP_0114572882 /NCGR_PEP_ID=MMETSP0114-20121206/18548_1 /TAXON_ID=31324 /ORGANISM="Goniomonas sp, Strain m" /LENGTH=58 /DNA_ID=CAMNT_0001760161 /DNA_START=83 /DNA_END=256 /DNA_ORIENTATION=+
MAEDTSRAEVLYTATVLPGTSRDPRADAGPALGLATTTQSPVLGRKPAFRIPDWHTLA